MHLIKMSSPTSNPTPSLAPAAALPLSAKALRTVEQPISFLISEVMKKPSLINLAAGLVDAATLPVAECDAITRRIFADPVRGRAALQYDTTLGLSPLRRALVEHLSKLEGLAAAEMSLTADDLLLTTGSQQALYLIGDALIDPGDIVIAANPSYFVYTGALSSLGARIMTVPIDRDGMDVEAVGRLLARIDAAGELARVKLVYCTSFYQNPTGLTLSQQRRPRLLEIVRAYGRRQRVLILEDAAYRELRYDGPAHRSIKSYDRENQFTVLSHTFSKPFAPGLKLGYTAMPADLLEAVLHQKGNHDFGSSNLTQHIALEALNDGSYAEHVHVLRRAYRAKRDVMLAALRRFMPAVPGLNWTHPDGGLYSWVTLPIGVNTSRGGAMFNACVEAGVIYVPGEYCMQADETGKVPTNCLRLSFGQVETSSIEPGIERLAAVIRRQLGAPARPGVEVDPSNLKPVPAGPRSNAPKPEAVVP
jgi:2-aminoadipate transaminase